MTSASALRAQIEAALADRIPSALTPAPRTIRPVVPVGILSVDALLEGGLPVGAITEIVGPECSGRTSLALSFVARMTETGKVCAWVDVSNALDPETAAAMGVDLPSLLWVRCGFTEGADRAQSNGNRFSLPGKYLVAPPTMKGLHGGGCGPHPRGEVNGLSDAVGDFLRPQGIVPRSAEQTTGRRLESEPLVPLPSLPELQSAPRFSRFEKSSSNSRKPWKHIEKALRVADLLLQAGGFGAIILDMAGIAQEDASRVPLATWFRYRAAVERTQTSLLLLTQNACAKSSAGLLLSLRQGHPLQDEPTVFTGVAHRVEVTRERFKAESNVIPLRKPPLSERGADWKSRTTWAARR